MVFTNLKKIDTGEAFFILSFNFYETNCERKNCQALFRGWIILWCFLWEIEPLLSFYIKRILTILIYLIVLLVIYRFVYSFTFWGVYI